MVQIFPVRLYAFQGHETDLERRRISGGVAINGYEDEVEIDGGGRLYAVFTDAALEDIPVGRAWKAASARYGGGRPIAVPLGDTRYQGVGRTNTPRTGGLPWWDESDYAPIEPEIMLTAAAAEGATTLALDVSLFRFALAPGMWLGLDHPTFRFRMYQIDNVTSDNGTAAVVTITPPLRDVASAGNGVDPYDPKCMMHIEGGMASPSVLGYAAGSVRFVEDFSGDYE